MRSMQAVRCVFSAAIVVVGALHAEVVDGVAVKVNEEIITISEIEESLAAYQQAQGRGKVTRQAIVDKMVEKVLVIQEARRAHLMVSPDDIDAQVGSEIETLTDRLGGEEGLDKQLERENITFEELKRQYRQRVRRQMLYMRMMHKKEQEFRDKVTIAEDEVAGYLEKHGDNYRSAEVSMINFPLRRKARGPARDRLETKARGVLRELRGGGDFAKLAVKHDPAAADNGGYIGRVRYTELSPELAEAVFSVGKREQGKPVFRSSKQGFYILVVDDVREATLENSGDDARARLVDRKTGEEFDAWLAGLKKKASIKVMDW